MLVHNQRQLLYYHSFFLPHEVDYCVAKFSDLDKLLSKEGMAFDTKQHLENLEEFFGGPVLGLGV